MCRILRPRRLQDTSGNKNLGLSNGCSEDEAPCTHGRTRSSLGSQRPSVLQQRSRLTQAPTFVAYPPLEYDLCNFADSLARILTSMAKHSRVTQATCRDGKQAAHAS
jgi:hypothetical protein